MPRYREGAAKSGASHAILVLPGEKAVAHDTHHQMEDQQTRRLPDVAQSPALLTERQRSHEAMRQSEKHVRLKLESILSPEGDIGELALADILDAKAVQALMDDFYELAGIPMSILDLQGNILVSVGWQEVCTRYHRVHPQTSGNCMESDSRLSSGLAAGEFRLYKCLNHMWDVAAPLTIGGKHAGNLFCGQFFFDDEVVDLELFRSQAATYGFSEREYLAAVQRVPRLSRKALETGMRYLMKLGSMLSLLSYSNIKLARALAERDRLMAALEAKERKLREGEERWRLAIESIGLGTFDVDLQTGETAWSALAKQQFGLPPDAKVDYQTFVCGLHADDREHVELALAEARQPSSGGKYVDEYRAVGPADGRVRWLLAWGQFFFDERGLPIRLLGIRRDVTERKQAEAALRETQAKLEAALASMTDAVFISDAQGRFIHFNEAFAAFHRFQNKDDCATTLAAYPDILDVFLPDGALAPPEMWAVSRALRGETVTYAEYTLRRKDTGETWVGSYSFGPIRDAGGAIAGSVVVARDITERKRAEEALRESEERFRTLFESMDEGFASCEMIYDQAGQPVDFRYLAVNPGFARLTGLPVDQVAGRKVREVIPGIEPFWIETYGRVARTGNSERVEYRVASLDRWFEVFAWSPGPGQFAVVFRNTTESRRAAQALRRLSELVDLSHDAIITADADRVIRSWNAGAKELYGWTAAEAVGRKLNDLLQTQASPGTWELNEALQRSGRWDGELTQVAKDGAVLWVESCQVLESNEDATAVLEINRDITARKRAEEAVRANEAQFRTLANAIPQLCWMANADGAIVWYNERWYQYTGTTPEQMEGWGWQSVHDPEALPDVLERWKASLATGEPFDMIFPLRGADGVFRPFLTRVMPVRDQEGKVVRWFGTNTDISEQRKVEEILRASEEQLQRFNNELEQRVRDRTAQLEAANKELEAFAYSVSHDLRSPLRGIDGWSFALLEDYADQLDGRGKEYLSRVRSEAQRMGVLINDLLQLSRVTRDPMQQGPVDLTAMVESVAARLRQSAPDRPLEFVIQRGLAARGDSRLLEVAVTNLLDNAVKYTARCPRPRIEVSESVGPHGPAFYVRDNGVGFDMAYAGKLFGAFQRFHRYAEFPGSGIGLATVQRIIHRHGGHIWADAVPDGGATFYFTLPASEPRALASGTRDSA